MEREKNSELLELYGSALIVGDNCVVRLCESVLDDSDYCLQRCECSDECCNKNFKEDF